MNSLILVRCCGRATTLLLIALNPRTRGLIGARELALMKPSAYLVNCARGAIVDEAALADALARRCIAGAGLDVFANEPIPNNHPFFALDNVILTPHAAGRTEESIRAPGLSACRAVLAVSRGEPPPYVANCEVLDRPGLAREAPPGTSVTSAATGSCCFGGNYSGGGSPGCSSAPARSTVRRHVR